MEWLLGGALGPQGTLVFLAPDWLVLVAVSVALIGFATSLPGERPLLARVAEALLWAAALAGLVLALSGPTWVEEEGRTEPGRVAVLVDASRSMSVLEDGAPRSEVVAALLEGIDGADVDIYHFGEGLVVGRPTGYDLGDTDLEGALTALGERLAGERLAGLAVISDGLDRGLLRRRFLKEKTPAAPALPGPLTVYQVGSAADLDDLAVRSVDVGGYAFVRSPFKVHAELEGVGYEGRSITATLLRDGEAVSQQKVVLDDKGHGAVVFEVVPDKPGRFSYAVQVPVYEGDAVPSNNVLPVVVRVVRDRIRVLQVAGAPSWDVKVLRRFLKGDPSVDLVSFFILRTNDDIRHEYRDRELSLIQFPYERLFREDLWSFDIVIFQNFDYRPYFSARSGELLGNLARFVSERGHAFVMTGGDRSFGLGRYGNSALAEVLPLEVDDAGAAPDLEVFRPTLTAAGARHPVTRLAGEPAENAAWWARLRPMDGTNVVLGPAPGAAVLLAHPTRKTASGQPLPILAVREVGAGRTMALTVDSSWRWSLSEAAEGRGNQAYLRFWKNAMRWLMGDPTVSRVTVDTPRENYAIGDEVRVVVRVRDPGFAPLSEAAVTAVIHGPSGAVTLEGESNADGEVVLSFEPSERGAHRVEVKATLDGATIGKAQTVFAATSRDPELDEVLPDTAFLQWLAAGSEGRYYAAGERGPVVRDPGVGRVVVDRRETSLARAPLLAGWVLIFGGLGWIVRRRSGLR